MRLMALNTPLTRRLWARLRTGLAVHKVVLHITSLDHWQKAMQLDDIVFADAGQVGRVPAQNLAFALHVGQKLAKQADRDRTFRVASSDGAADICRKQGHPCDRIIFGATDVDTYFPSERQRLGNAKVPVVLHNSPVAEAAEVQKALGKGFTMRDVGPTPDADTLRSGDLWLAMDATDGLCLTTIDALATGLVVVGAEVGILWPEWWDGGNGAFQVPVGYTPQQYATALAAAWEHRGDMDGRRYAREWFNLAVLAQKWLEGLSVAAKRFKEGTT